MLCVPGQAEHEQVETSELKRDPNINIEPGHPSQPYKAMWAPVKTNQSLIIKTPVGSQVQPV